MNDIVAIMTAADFAARKHANHRRQGEKAEPHLNHLIEVAVLVAEATDGHPDAVGGRRPARRLSPSVRARTMGARPARHICASAWAALRTGAMRLKAVDGATGTKRQEQAFAISPMKLTDWVACRPFRSEWVATLRTDTSVNRSAPFPTGVGAAPIINTPL